MEITENFSFTYDVFKKYIRNLSVEYPKLQVASCGKSLLDRDITALVAGSGERNVLYVGGTHGMEWLTSLLLLKFLKNLMEAQKNNGELYGYNVRELLENCRLIVIPELNPDGIEIAQKGSSACGKYKGANYSLCNGDFSKWSANARGVDINHNFNADWYSLRKREKESGITGPSPRRFGGFFPESEPETQAVCRICRNVNIETLISFHSQGEEIFYEYGENTPKKSLNMAKIFSAVTDYTLVKNEGLASSGGLKDWFIEEFRRPGFTVEAGKGENPLPVSQLDEIYSSVEGLMVLGLFI